MFKTILFDSKGIYSGWKEYSTEPKSLPKNEYLVATDAFEQKEFLMLSNGTPVISNIAFQKAIISKAKAIVEEILLDKAIQMGYTSVAMLLSYAEDNTNPVWQAEGIDFRRYRTLTWMKFHELENTTLTLRKKFWSKKELVSVLPVFEKS
jgi:hypothetical protein